MKITNLYKEKENTEVRYSIIHKENGEKENLPYELLNEHLIKVYINEREKL